MFFFDLSCLKGLLIVCGSVALYLLMTSITLRYFIIFVP